MAGHIDYELRCSALLPLSEMAEAFEAAMELVGEYQPEREEIMRRWQEAAEDLSQHFAATTSPVMPPGIRPTALKSAMEMRPYLAVEWVHRLNDCLAEPAVQEMLRAAMEATAAYRVAQMAFVGGAPDRYVREFLRRAVQELIER